MAANSPVYSVLASFGGVIHRGEDREAAHRAYGEAVKRVQQEGEGSVTLLCGFQVLERFQPQPQAQGKPWLSRLLGWRQRRG